VARHHIRMGHSLTGASDSQICTASGVKNAKISGSVLGFVTVTLHCSAVASAPDAEAADEHRELREQLYLYPADTNLSKLWGCGGSWSCM